jgi:membrane-bound serine protease (ClpP class)
MDLVLSVFAILVGAVICIWLEFVVPSHGILALCFLLLCLAALVLSLFVSVDFAALTLIILLVIIPAAGWCGFRYYPRSPIAQRIFLRGQRPPILATSELKNFINKEGVAGSVLRPSGVCTIENQRLACVSENAQIEAGQKVRVIGVSGNYLIVQPIT